VNGARDELLARAALPEDEHGGVGRRHGVDERDEPAHAGRIAEEPVGPERAGDLPLEITVAREQPLALERALDRADERLGRLERLDQEVVRPGSHRLHGARDRPRRRHQDHDRRRCIDPSRREHVHARAVFEVEVRENDVDFVALSPHGFDGLARRRHDLGAKAGRREEALDQAPHERLVVDDQDGPGRRGARAARSPDGAHAVLAGEVNLTRRGSCQFRIKLRGCVPYVDEER
jgi:hypothetical protein